MGGWSGPDTNPSPWLEPMHPDTKPSRGTAAARVCRGRRTQAQGRVRHEMERTRRVRSIEIKARRPDPKKQKQAKESRPESEDSGATSKPCFAGVWAAWVASGPHKPFRARTDAVLQSIRFGTLHRYSLDLVPLRKQAERQRGCADGTPTFEGGRISRSVRSVTLNGHDRWDSNTGDLNGVPRSTGKWIEPGSGAPGSLNMVS